MDALEILVKGWPIILGGIMLIAVLSKLENRVSVLEEKAKSLFELLNKKKRTSSTSHHPLSEAAPSV